MIYFLHYCFKLTNRINWTALLLPCQAVCTVYQRVLRGSFVTPYILFICRMITCRAVEYIWNVVFLCADVRLWAVLWAAGHACLFIVHSAWFLITLSTCCDLVRCLQRARQTTQCSSQWKTLRRHANVAYNPQCSGSLGAGATAAGLREHDPQN